MKTKMTDSIEITQQDEFKYLNFLKSLQKICILIAASMPINYAKTNSIIILHPNIFYKYFLRILFIVITIRSILHIFIKPGSYSSLIIADDLFGYANRQQIVVIYLIINFEIILCFSIFQYLSKYILLMCHLTTNTAFDLGKYQFKI